MFQMSDEVSAKRDSAARSVRKVLQGDFLDSNESTFTHELIVHFAGAENKVIFIHVFRMRGSNTCMEVGLLVIKSSVIGLFHKTLEVSYR